MKIFSFTSLQNHHRHHHHFDVHTKLRDSSSIGSSSGSRNSNTKTHHLPPCESEVCRHTGNSTTTTHEEIKNHRKKFEWRSSSTSSWYRSSAKPVFEQHHHDGDIHHQNDCTNVEQQQTERTDSHRCRTVSDVSTVSFNTAVLTNSAASSPTAGAIAGARGSPTTTTSRHVVFGEVEIREYDVTVGDHPLCMTGCPLSLDWTYSAQTPVPVDEFELCRTPTRRDRNYLRTSWEHRHKLLVEDGTCSEVEIRRINRKLHRDRCCYQRMTEKNNIAFFQHCPTEIDHSIVVGTCTENEESS